MITLADIKMVYGSRTVLDIPALSFKAGRLYAVIGANGSGKSTLLKIIAGTLQPSTGSVTIPEALGDNRGYMPQQPYMFSFSVGKNVTISVPGKNNAESAALKALKAVGMEKFAHAKGRSLSGGEAQRVAIARMIAMPRGLLILDEPTSSTDIAGNDLVENALREYCRNHGCTMIFSTHSPAQAMRLSDQLLMLHEGRIIEAGPTEHIINTPTSTQGADFLKHWKI